MATEPMRFVTSAPTALLSHFSTYRYIWLEKLESRDENLVEKKYENNAHMITIGLNFHF